MIQYEVTGKGEPGIHGRPNQSEFLKGIQGSTDSWIGPNF